MTNLEYCNEILSIIGNVREANDAIYNLAFDAYQKLGGKESQPSLATIYNELKNAIQIWDNTDSLNITENGTYKLFGKNIIVDVSGGSILNDEIWYTSTDGKIVEPSKSIGQGWPNIISNTYKNGKGIIKFASNITSIVANAFYNKNKLNSIIIPDGITFIDGASFYGCSITSIIIPENVTTIGRIDTFTTGAFESSRLNSVIINNKVRTIGTKTFRNCSNLRNITYNGTKSQWNSITKGNYWKDNVPATVVHCTDGDVAI